MIGRLWKMNMGEPWPDGVAETSSLHATRYAATGSSCHTHGLLWCVQDSKEPALNCFDNKSSGVRPYIEESSSRDKCCYLQSVDDGVIPIQH
jgi:hypothetical protein